MFDTNSSEMAQVDEVSKQQKRYVLHKRVVFPTSFRLSALTARTSSCYAKMLRGGNISNLQPNSDPMTTCVMSIDGIPGDFQAL